jgi:hypothetical protein
MEHNLAQVAALGSTRYDHAVAGSVKGMGKQNMKTTPGV